MIEKFRKNIKKTLLTGTAALMAFGSSAENPAKISSETNTPIAISKTQKTEESEPLPIFKETHDRLAYVQELEVKINKTEDSLGIAQKKLQEHTADYSEYAAQYNEEVKQTVEHLRKIGEKKSAHEFEKSESFVDSLESALKVIVDNNSGKDLTKHVDQISGIVLSAQNPHTGKIVLSEDIVSMTKSLGQTSSSADVQAHEYFGKAPKNLILRYLEINQDKKDVLKCEQTLQQLKKRIKEIQSMETVSN